MDHVAGCFAHAKIKIDRPHHDVHGLVGRNRGFFASTNWVWIKVSPRLVSIRNKVAIRDLYSVDVTTGKKTALTHGKYEVQACQLSMTKGITILISNHHALPPVKMHFINCLLAVGKAKNTSLTGHMKFCCHPMKSGLPIVLLGTLTTLELFFQGKQKRS